MKSALKFGRRSPDRCHRMASDGKVRLAARRAFAVYVSVIALVIAFIALDTLVLEQHCRPLRVGFNEVSPYIAIGGAGEPAGLAVDVIKEASKRSGQPIKWVRTDSGEADLEQGRIDVFPLMTVTPERDRKLHFSDPWWENTFVLVFRREAPLYNPADTKGKKIGIRSKGHSRAIAGALFPQARMVAQHEMEPLAAALCRGELDGIFADAQLVDRILRDEPGACSTIALKTATVSGAAVPLATVSTFLVRNRADHLYSHIDEIVSDGTLSRLAAAYEIVVPDGSRSLTRTLWQDGKLDYLTADSAA